MQVPVEISFHDVKHSDWAEKEIRERVAKLEKRYDHITSCRVRVEQRAKHKNDTAPPVVHIEIGIPGGKNVVVSPEPGHLQRKFQTPDLSNAIHDSFHIAERQLVELKNQRHQRTKQPHHDLEQQFLGQVTEIYPDRRPRLPAERRRQLALFPPQQPAVRRLRRAEARRPSCTMSKASATAARSPPRSASRPVRAGAPIPSGFPR